jgi:zinc protease
MKKIFAIILLFGSIATANAQLQPNTTMSFYVDGIKVILRPTVKDVVNIRVFFRGGVNNYPLKQAGIEKFTLEALVQCGTRNYLNNRFKDTADYYGIDIGSAAAYDYGDIDVDCISKYFDKAWDLLADAMMRPTFEAGEVELLRKKLIATVKQGESEPEVHNADLLIKNAFGGTVYETDPDGTEESLSALTPTDLEQYYQSIFNKGQMFIVVAGNISKAQLAAKIHASFTAVPAKNYVKPALTEPQWEDGKVQAESRELPLNYISAIMNAPQVNTDDFVAYRMGMSILSSFLFNDLRVRMHLSYNPGADVEMRQMPYAYMFVSTDDPQKAVREMKKELLYLKYNTITEETLKRLVNAFITTYYLHQESTAAITGTLGTAEVLDSWTSAEQLPDKLNGITTKQINDVVNQYVKGLRWSYLGNTNVEGRMESAGDFKTQQ